MLPRSVLYDRLAELFAYPEQDYRRVLDRCLEATRASHRAAAAALAPLSDRVRSMTLAEVQELYTRTFDINPVCTLEVGWHVYGEDYARGAFLVSMRQRLRELNLPESCELPDHLTHVLALLGRIDGDEADELVARYLLPALEKMLGGMDPERQPYRAILEAVQCVALADHDVKAVATRAPRGNPPGWSERLPVFGMRGETGGCPAGRDRGREP